MENISREFQVFAKPVGAICNLDCHYCYYLEKKQLYPKKSLRMTDEILEKYIIQQIEATTENIINFTWHGGEPTIFGLDSFRKIVQLQKKYKPKDKEIVNGIQTNGTLLDEKWCEFFASEKFMVGISIDGPGKLHNHFRLSNEKKPTFEQTIQGYQQLQRFQVHTEILCVVNARNVQHPQEIYDFFKQLDAKYITFLPLVERQPESD